MDLEKLKLAALEQLSVSAVLYDPESCILWANQAFQDAAKKTLKELQGQKCYKVWNRNEQCAGCAVAKALKSGKVASSLMSPSNPEGCPVFPGFWIAHATPVKDEREQIAGVLVLTVNTKDQQAANEALQRSLALLNITQKLSKTGGWEWDTVNKKMFWTEEAYRIHGFDPDELLAGSPEHADRSISCYAPEDQLIISEAFRKCAEEGIAYDLEFLITNAHGQKVWIHTVAEPLTQNGRVIKVIGNIVDITRQREVENDYLTLFHEMLDGFALHEIICNDAGEPVDYRFLKVNPAFERMTGLKAADIEGKTVLEILPATEKHWIETYGRVSLTGEPAHFENISGALGKFFEVSAYQPSYGQFACIFTDATERTMAKQKLKESEERFKALHNASFGGITIHDKGTILECNQGLSTITGFSIEELIGMNSLMLIAEKSRDLVRANIKVGYEKPYEVYGLRKSGEEYPLRLEARNIPYKGKEVRVVEFRDITDLKKSEEERESLREQLIQSQKIESVGRLAGGIAHDFNNMLSVILGHTELALEQLSPSHPLFNDLQEIRKAATRSANLTQQLLAFARKQTVTPKVLDLNETVEGMLKMLRRLIGEDIDLAWLPKPEPCLVKMDPSQIDQILANLCVNARDAIENNGKVTIETSLAHFNEDYCRTHVEALPGDFINISVSDNGSGMDQVTMKNLFEPFFTTKELGKGTGLGLATIYGIVKQNNGFINVYSEPEHGSTFKVYLPRHEKIDGAADGNAELAAAVKGKETILLVEDEPAILKIAAMLLERQGYKVLTAKTPSEALTIAKNSKNQIAMLMTDVIMPDMNGRELANKLSERIPTLKVLFMSGYTANIISRHGVLDDGMHFIQKPFSISDLATKVREVLDEE